MKGFLRCLPLLAWLISFRCDSALAAECDFDALVRTASQGGKLTFECDATILFSKTIVITNQVEFDASGHSVTFDGDAKFRFFEIAPGGSLTLRNITLTKGYHEGLAAEYAPELPKGLIDATNGEGGAVRNAGRLEAYGCVFSNNFARGGAGKYYGPTLAASTGVGKGGAIFSSGELVLENCRLGKNSVTGGTVPLDSPIGPPGTDGLGGGLYVEGGSATLRASIFSENTAIASRSVTAGANGLGGGIYVSAGSVTIESGMIISNSAAGGLGRWSPGYGAGGGIYVVRGDVRIARCSVESNQVVSETNIPHSSSEGLGSPPAKGGGLFVDSAAIVNIEASTFKKNLTTSSSSGLLSSYWIISSGLGGAIWNQGQLTVSNSTLFENTAQPGDADKVFLSGIPHGDALGGAIYASGTNSSTILSFCTVARNRAHRLTDGSTNFTAHGGGIYRENGRVLIDHSILADNTPENIFGAVSDSGTNIVTDNSLVPVAQTTSIVADAKLGRAGFYGGPTETLPLLSGSPAIDAAECHETVDQRGQSRSMGPACDIGAYEKGTNVHYVILTTDIPPWTPLTARAGTNLIEPGTNTSVALGEFQPGRYEVVVTGQGVTSPVEAIEIRTDSPEIIDVKVHIERDHAADLGISQQLVENTAFFSVPKVGFGDRFYYQLIVTNHGPGTARNIELRGEFFGDQFLINEEGAALATNTILTNLPDLDPLSSAIVYIRAQSILNGTLATNRVSVTSSEDLNYTNDVSTGSVQIRQNLGDKLAGLTLNEPFRAPQTLVYDPASGKAFFGWAAHGLMTYDPRTRKINGPLPLNLGPFGVQSLSVADAGILYIGAGDRVFRMDTRSNEVSSFNLVTNFTSYLSVSPVDPDLLAVANKEGSLQLYSLGNKLADGYFLGGPIAFSSDGQKLFLKPELLQNCDLVVLAVSPEGLSVSATNTNVICNPVAGIKVQDDRLYLSCSPLFPGVSVVWDSVSNTNLLVTGGYHALAPHLNGTFSAVTHSFPSGGVTIQRFQSEPLTMLEELEFPFSEIGAYGWGTPVQMATALGNDGIALRNNHAIFFVQFDQPTPRIWVTGAQQAKLRFFTERGTRYRIERSSDLKPGSWSELQQVTGTGGIMDAELATSTSQSFFRIVGAVSN